MPICQQLMDSFPFLLNLQVSVISHLHTEGNRCRAGKKHAAKWKVGLEPKLMWPLNLCTFFSKFYISSNMFFFEGKGLIFRSFFSRHKFAKIFSSLVVEFALVFATSTSTNWKYQKYIKNSICTEHVQACWSLVPAEHSITTLHISFTSIKYCKQFKDDKNIQDGVCRLYANTVPFQTKNLHI